MGLLRRSSGAVGAEVILSACPDALVVVDRDLKVVWANPTAEERYADGGRFRGFDGLVSDTDLDLLAAAVDRVRAGVAPVPILVHLGPDGDDRPEVEVVAAPVGDVEPPAVVLSLRAVEGRSVAGGDAPSGLLADSFAANPTGQAICSVSGGFVLVNAAFCRLVGRNEAEVRARSYGEVLGLVVPEATGVDGAAPSAVRPRDLVDDERLAKVLAGEVASFTVDCVIERPAGESVIAEVACSGVEDGRGIRHLLVQAEDVTAARMHARSLAENNLHDELTGLANRVLLDSNLEQARALHRRHDRGVALLVIDLDDFASVNEGFGRAAGNAVLRAVADRLTARYRETDTVARLQGDRFAVLLGDSGEPGDAEHLTAAAVDLFEATFPIGGDRIQVHASVGLAAVAKGEGSAASTRQLVADAELAMQAAKRAGKACWRAFEPLMRDHASVRMEIRQALRSGIDPDAVEVHYQPVVDVTSGAPVALEALARWRHPVLGLLRPGDFIALAAEMGLVTELDRTVLGRIGAHREQWSESDPELATLPVSVNVNTAEIGDGLVRRFREFIGLYGLGAGLSVEVSEATGDLDRVRTRTTMRALHELGVGVTVDGFGSAAASMALLSELPVDVVKFDRSLLGGEGGTAELLAPLATFCEALDLEPVAQGVEDAEQHRLVTEAGIRRAQGFHYAGVHPVEDLPRVLKGVAEASARAA